MSSQNPPAANPAPNASDTPDTPDRLALRCRAEAAAAHEAIGAASNDQDLPPALLQKTLHELRVHQIELELQNEELRHAQLELETSRARYLDLYELAPVGYCSVSESGLLFQANLTLVNLIGLVRSNMRSLLFSHFVHQADQDRWYQMRRQLLDSAAPQTTELRLRHVDGASVWVQLTATLAPVDAGQQLLHIAVSDISKLKQAQEDLRRSQQTLARSNTDLRRFSEVTAHHLQEPARRMASFADLLARQLAGKFDNPEVQMSLDFIAQQARYQKNLLRDVQRYLAAEQPLGPLAPVDATVVVAQVLEILAERVATSAARMTVGELPPVWFDAPRLSDVFELLIDNALRYGAAPAKPAAELVTQPVRPELVTQPVRPELVTQPVRPELVEGSCQKHGSTSSP
ncbi:MAG: PAS domain S-box protein, partial [Rhodoferax sp.]|nr:PAS domain S-box protein [Rhodoferax sp.]